MLNCHAGGISLMSPSASADVVGGDTTESSEGTSGGSRRLEEQYPRGFRLLDPQSGIQGTRLLGPHQPCCMDRISEMFKVLEGFWFFFP